MDPLKSSAPVAPLDPIAESQRRATTAPPPPSSKGEPGAAPVRDSVTLSQAARLLAAAAMPPSGQSGATQARLAGLKKSIAEGTYVINQKAIARSLIQDNLDLLSSTPAPPPSSN